MAEVLKRKESYKNQATDALGVEEVDMDESQRQDRIRQLKIKTSYMKKLVYRGRFENQVDPRNRKEILKEKDLHKRLEGKNQDVGIVFDQEHEGVSRFSLKFDKQSFFSKATIDLESEIEKQIPTKMTGLEVWAQIDKTEKELGFGEEKKPEVTKPISGQGNSSQRS